MHILRKPIYNRLENSPTHRYDFNIIMSENINPLHGIIGQSFWNNTKINGALDYYNTSEVTTRAQAEGAIEGLYTDYITHPFTQLFTYSMFNKTIKEKSKQVRSAFLQSTDKLH